MIPLMAGSYEPPVVEIGAAATIGEEGLIAPGVRGYAVLWRGKIYIPAIIAEKEGSGDVGRFLDSLSPRCVIPTVTSRRLMGMLIRRGFSPKNDGEGEVWSR